jgi:SAM-dependent methyltransferase
MGSAGVHGPLWGARPDQWSRIQEPLHGPLMRAMLDAARVEAGTRLLDVGCGGGHSSGLAVKRGARVTGLDASEGMVDYARQAVPEAVFRVGDIQDLPFEDQSFEVVFAANSVQYAEDLLPALRELRRVCAQGGRIVAGLFGPPHEVAYASVFAAVNAALPPPPPGAKPGGPFVLSGPGVLEGKFVEAGLTVTGSGEADCPFTYADAEEHWRGFCASGSNQKALGLVGEEKLKSAVAAACGPYTAEDGSLSIGPNVFVYVVGTV